MRGRKRGRSATAPSPERALVPVIPPRTSSPTRSGSSPTCWSPTAPRRWRASARRRCR
jgi:hypothetical protein